MGSSETINLSASNIPSIQFTNGEKGALAVAAAMLVASQIFPQLPTSFGWVCECGPISMVSGAGLAGWVVIRAHANHDSRLSAVRAKLASQTEKSNSLYKDKDDRISELKREIERGLSAANERIEELEAELASQTEKANSLCKDKDDRISELNHEIETLTRRLADQADHSSSESLGDQEALDESMPPFQEDVDDIHNMLDALENGIKPSRLDGDSSEEPEYSDEDERRYYSAQEEINE